MLIAIPVRLLVFQLLPQEKGSATHFRRDWASPMVVQNVLAGFGLAVVLPTETTMGLSRWLPPFHGAKVLGFPASSAGSR